MVLVDDAGLPMTLTQWPLPREAVQRALDTLPADLPPALAAARDVVQADLRAHEQGRIVVTALRRQDALSGFGDDATPGRSLQLRSVELDGPHLALQVGGRLDPQADSGAAHATPRLDESAVAADAFGWQAQAWAHRSWWGPGWQSSLPLGNNAPPLVGIGFQRAAVVPSESPWLSWLGPWNFDFFLARTEGEPPGPGSNPLLSGARLTFRPFSHVELGLTRMVQFGGEGHAETLSRFIQAVEGSRANVSNPEDYGKDSGNGLAGYDIRVRCPGQSRCAAYGQFMGEDDKKNLPYRFLGLLGTEVWGNDGVVRMYFELAEIGCRTRWRGPLEAGCAYRNYAYPGGYTASTRWLGASVGPDARLATIGWVHAQWDASVRLSFGRIGSHIGTFDTMQQAAEDTGRLYALSLRRGWRLGSATVTPEFDWNRVSGAGGVHVESRAGVELSMPLDSLGLPTPGRIGSLLSGDGPSSPTMRLLTAGALIGGAAVFDRPAESFATAHHNEPALKVFRQGGSALPFVEFGLAGAGWLLLDDPGQRQTALTSVESGLAAVATAEVLKLAVDRSRPREDRGAIDFGREKRSDSSFPSVHAALAWGVLTPIAQRYDAPWLYGVAALTNAARVTGRNHWLSDTVAGAVIGYSSATG